MGPANSFPSVRSALVAPAHLSRRHLCLIEVSAIERPMESTVSGAMRRTNACSHGSDGIALIAGWSVGRGQNACKNACSRLG